MFRGVVAGSLLVCLEMGCGGATTRDPQAGAAEPAASAQGGTPSESTTSAGEAGAPSCACVNATIDWWVDSNLLPKTERGAAHITPCSVYEYAAGPIGKPPTSSCTMPLAGCGEYSGVDTINAALADPDVQRALKGAPEVFGVDRRPDGGQADHIEVDQQVIIVGDACPEGDSSCVIPRGITNLDHLLGQIQMLSCEP